MGRGGRVGNESYGRRRGQSKDKGSDESDEDYMVGADEEFEDSEEYCSSLAGEESGENLGKFEEEEDEAEEADNMRKAVQLEELRGTLDQKKNGVGKAHKKRRVSSKEDNDEDYKEEEDEEEEEDEDGDDDDYDLKKNGVGKAHKKRRASYDKDEGYKDEDYIDDDYSDGDGDGDGDGDDDDDDADFAPDEFDFDDENELAVKKKNRKLGKPPLQEKGVFKRRKRNRSSKVIKTPKRKKPMKGHGFQRKSAAGSSGASTKKNPIVKKRRVKRYCPRKRRFVADSDSYFTSSGSSDFEFTISEEEREQVREASELCGDLTTILRNSSSEKRLQEEGVTCQPRKCLRKKGLQEEGVMRQPRKRLWKKGKKKVEDLKHEVGQRVCGICLSEEEKTTVRGTLNCCSHYYCFACIMEWSKVESRCPLCKQRFVTITKPISSNTGLDLRTEVVQVPERDQVYQPSEDELMVYLDPYENVICTECQHGGDDAFMLLCDLCDSPAHTYCVGLGREVPIGNWYCERCRPTALGSSSNPRAPTPTPDQTSLNGLFSRSSPVERVRREAIDLNRTYVEPETSLTEDGTGVSSPRRPPVSGRGASTVSERRRIQLQIRQLINSRTNDLGGRTNGISGTNLGNYILGSQIARAREIALQPAAITPEMLASHHAFSHRRLQNNFTAQSSHSRDQTSSSADGSPDGMFFGFNFPRSG